MIMLFDDDNDAFELMIRRNKYKIHSRIIKLILTHKILADSPSYFYDHKN